MDHYLALQLKGDGRGHIRVHGEAKDMPGSVDDDTLLFALDFDQTFLPALVEELEAVLAEFPILGDRP